jgi:uncharacterized protein (DUF779 family)
LETAHPLFHWVSRQRLAHDDSKEHHMQASRIVATPAAEALLDELKARHGDLMFHQSGGCCEGSAPMCLKQGEFLVGSSDVKLGEVHGVPFYMAKFQFQYWEHTHLTRRPVLAGAGHRQAFHHPLPFVQR